MVDLKLPEGAHLDATDDAARTLERMLLERPEVQQVASFMGRGAPRFYYNIPSIPWSPHFAQVMVSTRTTAEVDAVLEWVRSEAPIRLPGVEVIGKRLEQGPPVAAPVEVRVFADDLSSLHEGVTRVAAVLRSTPGTADVRHDLGAGEPTLHLAVDDAAAARFGISRAAVAQSLFGHTRGWPVGELRSSDDPVPIVVRSAAGERLAPESLAGLDVAAPDGRVVPIGQLVRVEAGWQAGRDPPPQPLADRDRLVPARPRRHLLRRAQRRPAARSTAIELPAGARIGFGGDAEGSGEANTAMLKTLPIGLLVLLGVLMAEFNSFRRVGIILITVPLAATGVIPGLLIAGQPFGFMSLLGVFALVGIVVNNAIVLLEVVDSRRREGATVDEALADAVDQRIRPILLTTATTVAGLTPLAFSSSTLWPPLAWAMISGLIASTVLTLIVVPALYRLLLGRPGRSVQTLLRTAPRAAALCSLMLVGAAASAEPPQGLPLEEAMRRGAERPAAEAAAGRARAADSLALGERRLSYLPTLGASFAESDRNRDLELVTPLGSFPFGSSRSRTAGIELQQPLFDPARLLHGNAASRLESRAAHDASLRTRQELAAEAAAAWLRVRAVEASRAATLAFSESLAGRLAETEQRVAAGRALEADALKIRLALESAQLDLTRLDQAHRVATADLARATGLTLPAAAVGEPLDHRARPVPDPEAEIARALDGEDRPRRPPGECRGHRAAAGGGPRRGHPAPRRQGRLELDRRLALPGRLLDRGRVWW